MTRLIDADKLRDSFGSHAYTRAAIKLRIDAAPTVCCESCRRWNRDGCPVAEFYPMGDQYEDWNQWANRTPAEFGCTQWEATDDPD